MSQTAGNGADNVEDQLMAYLSLRQHQLHEPLHPDGEFGCGFKGGFDLTRSKTISLLQLSAGHHLPSPKRDVDGLAQLRLTNVENRCYLNAAVTSFLWCVCQLRTPSWDDMGGGRYLFLELFEQYLWIDLGALPKHRSKSAGSP